LRFAIRRISLCSVTAGTSRRSHGGLDASRWHGSCVPRERMDVLYLGLAIGFFVLSWAFIVACERLS